MSDYEFEPEYVDPAETLDELGPPPEDGASDEEWAAWANGYEEEPAEGEQEINPFEYEGAPVGPFEQELGDEMRRQEWGQLFADDLAGFVAEAAKSSEFDLAGDPQAVDRVTGEILAAREQLFRSWLGSGASVAQATAALADLNIEAAIEVGLQQERYEAFSRADTSLGAWKQGQREQARKDALAGRPPTPSVYDSPTLQRMNRATAAYAERQLERQAQQRAVTDRVYGKQWWR